MKPRLEGFTLIEVLVALAVFSILAVMTSSAMYRAFTIKDRVSLQTGQLNNLQLALIIMNKSIYQATNRAVRVGSMKLQSALTGTRHHVELTHGGLINPGNLEKESTLQRIAYRCQNKQLIQRTWTALDTINPNQYQDKTLLSNLVLCHFSYLNTSLQPLAEWQQKQAASPLPKAIQLTLAYQKQYPLVYTFIIPKALFYDKN